MLSGPVRTCVVCRKKLTKRDLDRFIWGNNKPQCDEKQRMPGRGVYCCKDGKCLTKFHTLEKKWQRYFRK